MTNKNPGISFSIIIVNYNSGFLIRDCIASILKNADNGYEIIIYDNASSDDSLKLVIDAFPDDPRIRIMEGKDNLGFAKANNLAAIAATGKFLHFLNPDIIVNPALEMDYVKISKGDEDTVYVTSLAGENGKPVKNRHIVPTVSNYFNCVFRPGKVAYWNIGASLIISQHSFKLLGGWPEDYFMYAEDLDLFYRMHLQRLNIIYTHTRLVHIGQGSTRKLWDNRERAIRIERSFLKFYRKYGITWQYFLLRPVQLTFILFHEPDRFLLQLKTYLRIVFSKGQ